MLQANLNTQVSCVADHFQVFVSGKPLESAERNVLAPACGAFLRS
jgi:hypothetical protein